MLSALRYSTTCPMMPCPVAASMMVEPRKPADRMRAARRQTPSQLDSHVRTAASKHAAVQITGGSKHTAKRTTPAQIAVTHGCSLGVRRLRQARMAHRGAPSMAQRPLVISTCRAYAHSPCCALVCSTTSARAASDSEGPFVAASFARCACSLSSVAACAAWTSRWCQVTSCVVSYQTCFACLLQSRGSLPGCPLGVARVGRQDRISSSK
jgi:hypothetical protein